MTFGSVDVLKMRFFFHFESYGSRDDITGRISGDKKKKTIKL